MPTLKEKLIEVLPDVLPPNPEQSINGTELLKKIREEGSFEDYEDGAIRQYFSDLKNDPTTPIAKVDQGHGYFKRDEEVEKIEETKKDEGSTRGDQPEEKFRSILMRYRELENSYPVKIDHTKGKKRRRGVNKWKFPDVVVLKWRVGKRDVSDSEIDEDILQVKRGTGDPTFDIESIELKVSLKLSTFRQNFFQCVSNSKWANNANLVVAESVGDEKMAEELRRLGESYNVSVISYGISEDLIRGLPNAKSIRKMEESEFENVRSNMNVNKIYSGSNKEKIDWNHIYDMKKQSERFNHIFSWISKCISEQQPIKFGDFERLKDMNLD